MGNRELLEAIKLSRHTTNVRRLKKKKKKRYINRAYKRTKRNTIVQKVFQNTHWPLFNDNWFCESCKNRSSLRGIEMNIVSSSFSSTSFSTSSFSSSFSSFSSLSTVIFYCERDDCSDFSWSNVRLNRNFPNFQSRLPIVGKLGDIRSA